MTLILRKCQEDGFSRKNFYYPNVGERVTCPDWDPKPKCGNGLHGLKEGNGDWSLLQGEDWLIIDADDQVVDIDNYKCKFNTGIVIFRGTAKQLEKTDFCHKMQLNEESAFHWACYIGNKEIMANKMQSSYWIFAWSFEIGNHDILAKKITSLNSKNLTSLWNDYHPKYKIESN